MVVALSGTILDTAINRKEEGAVKVPCQRVIVVETMGHSTEVDVVVEAGTSEIRTTVEAALVAMTVVAAALAPTRGVEEGEEEEVEHGVILHIVAILAPAFAVPEGTDGLPTMATAMTAAVVVGGNKSSWGSIYRLWSIVWFVQVVISTVSLASQERAIWRCFNLVRLSPPSSPTWLADGIYALRIVFGTGSITLGLKRILSTIMQ